MSSRNGPTQQPEPQESDPTNTPPLDEFLMQFLTELEDVQIPEKRSYTVQDHSSDGQARINIHKDGIADSPASPGDTIPEYYIRELDIVILNLNPTED